MEICNNGQKAAWRLLSKEIAFRFLKSLRTGQQDLTIPNQISFITTRHFHCQSQSRDPLFLVSAIFERLKCLSQRLLSREMGSSEADVNPMQSLQSLGYLLTP